MLLANSSVLLEMAQVKKYGADILMAEQQAYLSARVRAGSRQFMTFEFWRFKTIILQKRPFQKQNFQQRLGFDKQLDFDCNRSNKIDFCGRFMAKHFWF